MRRLLPLLLAAVAGVVLFVGAALFGDARRDDPELALLGPSAVERPTPPGHSTLTAAAPEDAADQGDVDPASLTPVPGATGHTEVVALGPEATERAVMLDPERLAAVAQDGAEPYEPPGDDDVVDEAELREALADAAADATGEADGELPDGSALGITPLEGGDGAITRFFDYCATDDGGGEPAEGEGCPEAGFGATVLFPLNLDVPPPFRDGPAGVNQSPWLTRCPATPLQFRTQALLWHTSNRPADRIVVRYNTETGSDEWLEVASVPAPGELDRYRDRSPEARASLQVADLVHHCTVLPDLAQDGTGLRVEIVYEVGEQTYTHRINGIRNRRSPGNERPPLTLTRLGDHALATMTHTDAERSYYATIPRTGDGATLDSCRTIRDDVLGGTYRGSGILAQPRAVRLSDPIVVPATGDEYQRQTAIGVWPEEGVTYTLCAWYVSTDELGVTDAHWAEELQFTAPNRSRVRVRLLRYEAIKDTAAGSQTFVVEWPGRPQVAFPSDDVAAGGTLLYGRGEVVADSGAARVRPTTPVQILGPDGIDHPTRGDRMLWTPTELCPPVQRNQDERDAVCLGEYVRQLPFNVARAGSSEPIGVLWVEWASYDGPGEELRERGDDRDWNIGPTSWGDTTAGESDPVRLQSRGLVGGTATKLTLVDGAPRSAEVVLVGNRDFVVDRVHLDVIAIDEAGCDSAPQVAATPASRHTFRFDSLCPGTTYRVEYTLSSATSEAQSGAFGRVTTQGTEVASIQYFAKFTPEDGVTRTSWNDTKVFINGWTGPIAAGYCNTRAQWADSEFRGWRTAGAGLGSETELPHQVPIAITVRPHAATRDCDEVRPRAVTIVVVPAEDLLAGDVTVSLPVEGWGTLDVRIVVEPISEVGEPPVAPAP